MADGDRRNSLIASVLDWGSIVVHTCRSWLDEGNHKRQAGIGAAAVGLVAAVAVASMSASADTGIMLTAEGYPAGTTVVADPATLDAYQVFPTQNASTSYDSTLYAGRLWTDKSVLVPTSEEGGQQVLGTTATVALADPAHDLDGDGKAASPGVAEVDKTESGVFLTSISALSSSLQTQLLEPKPLDIVLVLDMSGSMTDTYSGATNVPYASYEIEALVPGQTLRNTKFRNKNGSLVSKAAFEGYCEVSENEDGSDAVTVPYINKYSNGNDFYIVTSDASEEGTQKQLYYRLIDGDSHNTPTDTWQSYTFTYTQLYHDTVNKLFELKNGVLEFVDVIAQNNTELYEQGYTESSMSRISVVQFSSQYTGGTWSSTEPNYVINDEEATTHIVSPLTTYTSGIVDASIAESSALKSIVTSLKASGSTAADYGLTLAKGVLDGKAYYSDSSETEDGARDGARQVVIFFTDGNPKHEKGSAPNDFSGLIAQQTLDVAREIKDEDILIYSVAVVDGADANDTTKNVNIYLNGVSNNYPQAFATDGADNPVSGTAVPAANTWSPTLGERAEGIYYYVAGGDTSLADAFSAIASDITAGGGGDATTTGRDGNTALTITDYLGDYMEFKGVDGILYGLTADTTQFYAPGTQDAFHTYAVVQRNDDSATQSTYHMWADVPSALLNPEEGKETVNLNLITVKVVKSLDAKTGDTVTITIPPELIPSLRYKVEQSQDGDIVTNDVTRTDADPLRIFYSIGPKASTFSNVIEQLEDQALRSENATNESDRQTEAYKSFLQDAAAEGKDGLFSLYNNKPTTANQGTATVSMMLSESNPYYFYVDEPLYLMTDKGYSRALASKYTDGTQLYRRERYWNVSTDAESDTYVEWNGSKRLGEDGVYYIPNGTTKTDEADATSVSFSKSDNPTQTATTSLVSAFDGTHDPSTGKYMASQFLGNNGRLDIPVYGTLAATKRFTAGEGFDLPVDPAPTATFTLSLKDKDGVALTEDDTYRALIRDASGHPVDPQTHAVVTNAADAKFYVKNGTTFTLHDGEIIKVTNLPDGATYQVTETGQVGYQATVTNNDGTTEIFDRGVDATTAPAASGE